MVNNVFYWQQTFAGRERRGEREVGGGRVFWWLWIRKKLHLELFFLVEFGEFLVFVVHGMIL